MKTALILGASGQDGTYLSRLLLSKHYVVHGTSREPGRIRERIVAHQLDTTDRDAMRDLLARLRPDEIYNLAGLSSVARSFEEPGEAWTSIAEAQTLLLDVAREAIPAVRVYQSTSSDCFGDSDGADEQTPFAPRSPYAEAKAAAHRATIEARERGLFACSGIVFNHESPLRSDRFVSQKIIAAAAEGRPLLLGDLSASRDWGYAAEHVEAMWRMLQQPEPRDFVIATGESHTVAELAEAAYAEFDLEARDFVITDPTLYRRNEIRHSRGNPAAARRVLGWEAATKFGELVRLLANQAAASRRRTIAASPSRVA